MRQGKYKEVYHAVKFKNGEEWNTLNAPPRDRDYAMRLST